LAEQRFAAAKTRWDASRRISSSSTDRRRWPAALSAAARCLDIRARCASLPGDVVTMAKVEFHFDFGSPNAYLAHLVIPEIEQRAGVEFDYVPILLGGVFKLTNNRSPAENLAGIKNKPEYERLEMNRFIRRHRITRFQPNPFFPVNTLTLMRGAIAARSLGVFDRYVDEMFRHMWADPKKMDDPRVFRAALE